MTEYELFFKDISSKHKTYKHFSSLKCGKRSKQYLFAKEQGWLENIKTDYDKLSQDRKTKILNELLTVVPQKYDTYQEFTKNTKEFYLAKYNGLLTIIKKEVFPNYEPIRHMSKWNDFDTCLEESKKYASRNDFRIFSPWAYQHAKKNYIDKENGLRWLDVMIPQTTLDSKVGTVYCYYFRNVNINGKKDAVYVGISIEPKRRDRTHRSSKNSSVYRFSKKYNIEIPPMTILVEKISVRETTRLEGYYVDLYSKDYHIINRAKCGVGTSATITYNLDGVKSYGVDELIEHIKNVAKYKTYEEFRINKNGELTEEYKRAGRLCCIREICQKCGFKNGHKHFDGDFNKFADEVRSLYDTYESFKHISSTNTRMTNMWTTAKRNGWLLKTVQTLYPDFVHDVEKYLPKFAEKENK